MKAKTFIILLLCAFAAALCVLALSNSLAQKLWDNPQKSDWRSGRIYGSDAYTLPEYKVNYISQKNLPYNAFLFGGSKSGSMQCATLNRYTGDTFYNFWTNGGCFENYETFSDYVLKTYKDINEIIICLSSHEVEHYKAN